MSEPLKDEWVFVDTRDRVPTVANLRLFRESLDAALPEAKLYADVGVFNPGTYVASPEEIAEAVKNTIDTNRLAWQVNEIFHDHVNRSHPAPSPDEQAAILRKAMADEVEKKMEENPLLDVFSASFCKDTEYRGLTHAALPHLRIRHEALGALRAQFSERIQTEREAIREWPDRVIEIARELVSA